MSKYDAVYSATLKTMYTSNPEFLSCKKSVLAIIGGLIGIVPFSCFLVLQDSKDVVFPEILPLILGIIAVAGCIAFEYGVLSMSYIHECRMQYRLINSDITTIKSKSVACDKFFRRLQHGPTRYYIIKSYNTYVKMGVLAWRNADNELIRHYFFADLKDDRLGNRTTTNFDAFVYAINQLNANRECLEIISRNRISIKKKK